MGKGKKKGYFNNKTKTMKVQPNEIFKITTTSSEHQQRFISERDKKYVNNHTYKLIFPSLPANNTKIFEQQPLLKIYSDTFMGNYDYRDYEIIQKRLTNASNEELDFFVKEYLEYHDNFYGIDYKTGNSNFTRESIALLIMQLAVIDKNYKLVDKLAKNGVTLDVYYDTDDHMGNESYVHWALSPYDQKLLEIVVENGGRVFNKDIITAFSEFNNNAFEYLVENVHNKLSLKTIFNGLCDISSLDICDNIDIYIDIIYRRIKLLCNLEISKIFDEVHFDELYINFYHRIRTRRSGKERLLCKILFKIYVELGIGTTYVDKEIWFISDGAIDASSTVEVHIANNGVYKKFIFGSNDYDIVKCIRKKHFDALEIRKIINNVIPQPIAEEIVPNISLL